MPVPERHAVLGTPLAPPFPAGLEQAIFGMGCFWGVERKFWKLDGVYTTAAGYAGGDTVNPTYKEVCSGATGHAEVVLVVFNPMKITYDALLKVFWENHDPTQGMRQGNDVGTQYRSAIYLHSAEQRSVAEDVIREAQAHYRDRIVTELVDAGPYWRAEDYHQEYFRHNPEQGYCAVVVAPKVAKFRKTFAAKRRNSAGD
jgi:peptide-methionine (S)-S-oxide reductase